MKKILLSLALICSCFFALQTPVFSASANNLNIGSFQSEWSQATANDRLESFGNGGRFIDVARGGERWLFNTLVRFARDLKNLFFAVATVLFLWISLRLIVGSNTDEEVGKFKKWIIWITVGIIVMQLAFAFVKIIFDRGVGETLAFSLLENLVQPLIDLLMTLASIFFLAMAIFAFYRVITANGNEENITKAKTTILYAIIGFIVVRFARFIVEAFYGRVDCNNVGNIIVIEWGNCLNRANLSGWVDIIVTIINWMNGFVGIAVVIMIIYVWVQILLSAGDEEKLKKWKQAIIYIFIGLLVLAANFLILTFFLIPQSAI